MLFWVVGRVADPVHFWPDPDPANQNFKTGFRIPDPDPALKKKNIFPAPHIFCMVYDKKNF